MKKINHLISFDFSIFGIEMENESNKFVDWFQNLTVSDAVNILLMIVFSIYIIMLVVRTFKNKPSA